MLLNYLQNQRNEGILIDRLHKDLLIIQRSNPGKDLESGENVFAEVLRSPLEFELCKK